MEKGGSQMKGLRGVKRRPGAGGQGLGRLAWAAGQTHLRWPASGLLRNVAGILLQSLDTHHHAFCLCEAAHQAREQARQGQGIGQHQAHQPWGEGQHLLGIRGGEGVQNKRIPALDCRRSRAQEQADDRSEARAGKAGWKDWSPLEKEAQRGGGQRPGRDGGRVEGLGWGRGKGDHRSLGLVPVPPLPLDSLALKGG